MQNKKNSNPDKEFNPLDVNEEINASTNENGRPEQFEKNTSEDDNNNGSDDELIRLKKENEEYKDKYLRLVAEFDNFRRRTAKERIELVQTAGKEVITSLLEVLDDSDRAEKQMAGTEDIAQLKEGVQLVFNKLRNTLQSKGLKPMQSIDTDFDVEKHEAITEIDVPGDKKGKVVDEVVKGYYLNDKLIRFAKVVVGK